MDRDSIKQEQQKIKELRKELEQKIKGIIPERLQEEPVEETAAPAEAGIDAENAKGIVEAVLFASSRPMTINELRRVVRGFTPAQMKKILDVLVREFAEGRSFILREIAGGYQFQTLPVFGKWILKSEKERKIKQASLAALETLAILAYKQPITRVEIEEIRGVDASGVLATLMDREFIKIVGRKEVPGRPLLYGTTPLFLEHFGLSSLEDLPDIREIKELVDNTIQREELLRKELKDAEDQLAVDERKEQVEEQKEQALHVAEQYEEIKDNIETVKVLSERQITEVINPPEQEEEVSENDEADAPSEDADKEETEEEDTHVPG